MASATSQFSVTFEKLTNIRSCLCQDLGQKKFVKHGQRLYYHVAYLIKTSSGFIYFIGSLSNQTNYV